MQIRLISIHALRVEGDLHSQISCSLINISIHALRVEGDSVGGSIVSGIGNFYPRPPGGGRLGCKASLKLTGRFLSTPSGWRATYAPSHFAGRGGFLSTPSGWRATRHNQSTGSGCNISIHALRVEGDKGGGWLDWVRFDFYPRPPGGGRPIDDVVSTYQATFLSTPSGWRATVFSQWLSARLGDFYPRPPGGGRPTVCATFRRGLTFLSTPSGWRATKGGIHSVIVLMISIHALRVEGDSWEAESVTIRRGISIHALRVEGDTVLLTEMTRRLYFYPRPPGGGRRAAEDVDSAYGGFLSTPSGWRATH